MHTVEELVWANATVKRTCVRTSLALDLQDKRAEHRLAVKHNAC